jgi:hypothetical protein
MIASLSSFDEGRRRSMEGLSVPLMEMPLVERLAKDLAQRFGRGFSRQNIGQMRAFFVGLSL